MAWRWPPRSRRWRLVWPEEAGMGFSPHREAKVASVRRRWGVKDGQTLAILGGVSMFNLPRKYLVPKNERNPADLSTGPTKAASQRHRSRRPGRCRCRRTPRRSPSYLPVDPDAVAARLVRTAQQCAVVSAFPPSSLSVSIILRQPLPIGGFGLNRSLSGHPPAKRPDSPQLLQ